MRRSTSATLHSRRVSTGWSSASCPAFGRAARDSLPGSTNSPGVLRCGQRRSRERPGIEPVLLLIRDELRLNGLLLFQVQTLHGVRERDALFLEAFDQ